MFFRYIKLYDERKVEFMNLEGVKTVELLFRGRFPSEDGGFYNPCFEFKIDPEDVSINLESILPMDEVNKINHVGRFGLGKCNIVLSNKALKTIAFNRANSPLEKLLEEESIYLNTIFIEYNRNYPLEHYPPVVRIDCLENLQEANPIKVSLTENGVSLEINCNKFMNDLHTNSTNPEEIISTFVTLVDEQTKLLMSFNREVLGLTSEEIKLKSLTIEDLDLSVRSYNCLKRAGFEYVRELAKLSDVELDSIRNLNKPCLTEIRKKCYGLGIETNFTTINPNK